MNHRNNLKQSQTVKHKQASKGRRAKDTVLLLATLRTASSSPPAALLLRVVHVQITRMLRDDPHLPRQVHLVAATVARPVHEFLVRVQQSSPAEPK